MKPAEHRLKALEKIAFGFAPSPWSPTVGISNPQPTVGNVLDAIGVAQARDIGTSKERKDAFGRIINSGLINTSPAENALRMVGGGFLGRRLVGAFTNNHFLKGLGAGFGATSAIRNW